MNDAAFGGGGSGTQYDAMMNTIVVAGGDGNNPLQDAQASAFIDNRCGQIVIEYEANTNAKLNAVLKVAPNPRIL